MDVGGDGGKVESNAPVQGGTHAWTQKVTNSKHFKALKGPTAQEFFWVCCSVEREPMPPGELLPKEDVISRSIC